MHGRARSRVTKHDKIIAIHAQELADLSRHSATCDGRLPQITFVHAPQDLYDQHDTQFAPLWANYGVFNEKRVFTPGPLPVPVNFRGTRLGLPICEDVWLPDCGGTGADCRYPRTIGVRRREE